jgi:hypothetical protein
MIESAVRDIQPDVYRLICLETCPVEIGAGVGMAHLLSRTEN